MDEFDVVVVGAGYGGATCGALLARRGLRVLVVDKNPHPGGKAMTVRKGGFGYELWPIAGGPSDRSRFQELAGLIGDEVDIGLLLPEHAGEFRYVRPDGSRVAVPFSARPSTDHAEASRLLTALGATAEEAANLLTMAATILAMPDEEIGRLVVCQPHGTTWPPVLPAGWDHPDCQSWDHLSIHP